MEDGVCRTISGRRVFIKNGQSLSDAMRESGKFNSSEIKEIKKIMLHDDFLANMKREHYSEIQISFIVDLKSKL